MNAAASEAPSVVRRVTEAVSHALGQTTVVLTLVLLVVVLWQVVSRYLFNDPAVVTEDLVGIFLPWVGLLGAAWTYGRGKQLAIELLPSGLSGNTARGLDVFIRVVGLFFAVTVMVVGGGVYAYDRFQRGQLTEVLLFPVAYIYLAIPVAGAFIALFSFTDIVDLIGGRSVPGAREQREG